MTLRHFAAAALLVMASASAAFAQDEAQERGRALSESFLANDLEPIWQDMTPPLQQAFGTLAGFEQFRAGLTGSFGDEVEILGESTETPQPGFTAYNRQSRWSSTDNTILMQWIVDDAMKIAGLMVRPIPVLAESRFLNYETRAELTLPFSGEWFVVWGGRTLEQNYHAADRAQRFALDLLIVRDGVSHSGDPAVLESYYCWDQPILSPAAGTVVAVENSFPDNSIGSTDPAHPAGNHVVLDMGGGEFAFLGHMRQGSITVAAGQSVAAGDPLGRCGNSGNTSEPHLHFHLQTTADLTAGEGLPAQFMDYRADGQPVSRGEPQAGQTIEAARP